MLQEVTNAIRRVDGNTGESSSQDNSNLAKIMKRAD
jgi:hypothetical protein